MVVWCVITYFVYLVTVLLSRLLAGLTGVEVLVPVALGVAVLIIFFSRGVAVLIIFFAMFFFLRVS